MPKQLYKTTIIIWSDFNPNRMEIDQLASNAIGGDSYCSKQENELITDLEKDPDWDGTEFFNSIEDDKEDEECQKNGN